MHYKLGERDKAFNTISQILNNNPNYLPALFTIAKAAYKYEQYQDAADYFKKILKLQPDNKEVLKDLEECEKQLADVSVVYQYQRI